MKKWLSMVLICSMLVTGVSTGTSVNMVKAEENNSANAVEMITDLDEYENNDLIVVYKDKSMSEKKMTKKTVKICDSAEENAVDTLTDNSMIVKLDTREELEEAIEAYSNDASVAYVQPNYVYHKLENVTITDTDYKKQWGMNNDGTYTYDETVYVPSENSGWFWNGGYTQKKETITAKENIDINAPEVWKLGTGADREVVVAFVDTGIKYDHKELADNMWVNADEIEGDGIDNDNNGYIDDVHGWNFYAADAAGFGKAWPGFGNGNNSSNGNNTYYNANSQNEDSHSTHCAGIVAAQANGTGVVGIAHQQNVKLMTVKVLGGSEGSGTTESVIKGIQYAADNGANICNLSLGGEEDDQALRDVIKNNSNVLFCVAAGNGGISNIGYDMDANGAVKEYPACYDFDNIITVANIRCNGELHYSSNYGSKSVDIAAPGAQIYSTSTVEKGYEYMTGTSMAAPMVSGVAALIYSYYDNVSIYDVKDMILNYSRKSSSLEGKVACGGMVDAYGALMKKGTTWTEKPSIEPSVTPIITPSAAPTVSPTVTPSITPTIAPSITPTVTPSIKPTNNPYGEDYDAWLDAWLKELFGDDYEEFLGTPSAVPTIIPTQTVQPTQTVKPTQTVQPAQTVKPTQAVQPIQTISPTQTAQPTQTISPTQTVEPTESAVVTPIKTPTAGPIERITPSPTKLPINTEIPIKTVTPIPTNEVSKQPVETKKPIATPEGTSVPTLGTSTEDELDDTQIILKTNKKIKLVVHHISSTEKVTWKSTNKSVAAITKNGVVKAKKAGKTKIIATLSNGKKLSCTVIVQPVTPIGVKAKQVKKKLRIRIKWGKVTGITGYEVLRATSKNGRYKVIKDVTKTGTKYYIDKKVTRKTYYYKVRAYKKLSNGSKIYSNFSSVQKVKVKR